MIKDLDDFNFSEIELWTAINLKYKYRKQIRWVPVYPNYPITSVESLKIAVGPFR